jgi:hypothetical protein
MLQVEQKVVLEIFDEPVLVLDFELVHPLVPGWN